MDASCLEQHILVVITFNTGAYFGGIIVNGGGGGVDDGEDFGFAIIIFSGVPTSCPS